MRLAFLDDAVTKTVGDIPAPPPPYKSFNIVFYQTFFDNLSKNGIQPFVESLPDRDLSRFDIINPNPIELDVLTINYNVTNFRFTNTTYDGSLPVIDIGDENYTFQMRGVNLTLAFDYEYVSDPPILADIGSTTIGVADFYLNLNG